MAKGNGPVVDFTGVESGGGARVRVPEGDYKVKVASVKQVTAKSGNEMLEWDFEFLEGKAKGKKVRDRTVLTPEALWKLKQLLEAMGKKVPQAKARLDLASYLGLELGITVVDEEYNNKIHSSVSDYLSAGLLDDADEDEDEDDEEEEEKPKSKKSKKSKKADDEDEGIEDIDLDDI
jgi:hypothetical protein